MPRAQPTQCLLAVSRPRGATPGAPRGRAGAAPRCDPAGPSRHLSRGDCARLRRGRRRGGPDQRHLARGGERAGPRRRRRALPSARPGPDRQGRRRHAAGHRAREHAGGPRGGHQRARRAARRHRRTPQLHRAPTDRPPVRRRAPATPGLASLAGAPRCAGPLVGLFSSRAGSFCGCVSGRARCAVDRAGRAGLHAGARAGQLRDAGARLGHAARGAVRHHARAAAL